MRKIIIYSVLNVAILVFITKSMASHLEAEDLFNKNLIQKNETIVSCSLPIITQIEEWNKPTRSPFYLTHSLDLKAKARNLALKGANKECEEVWDQIIQKNEQLNENDLRTVANVYYQNQSYEKSSAIYERLINSKSVRFDDLINFLYVFDKLRYTKKSFEES